jgi:hypothetical protein
MDHEIRCGTLVVLVELEMCAEVGDRDSESAVSGAFARFSPVSVNPPSSNAILNLLGRQATGKLAHIRSINY